MKKISIFLLAVTLVIIGCSKENEVIQIDNFEFTILKVSASKIEEVQLKILSTET